MYYPDSNYFIFWPDLAGCYYSKQTVVWMDENVKWIKNGLKIRFCDCLAQKVYGGDWEAESKQQFIRHIESKMKYQGNSQIFV